MYRKLLALGALVVLTSHALGQDVKVEKYVLPNGMTIILDEDHTLPIAAVNIWYRVGSKDEPDHRNGFAHLFEHLMFMGTHRVPQGEFDKVMEGGGGSNNASTAEDRTNYFESGPSNLLPTLLYLEADRLEDLGNAIDQKKLDLQRQVVLNERRQTTENTPYGKAYEAMNSLMFPPGHPYHSSVIGNPEDLNAAQVKDVQNFFATYYVPNNGSMVVAGDFDPKVIKPMIATLFGTLPRRNDPQRKLVPPIPPQGLRRISFVDRVEAPKTIMLWHSPAAYQPGDVEMNLASSVLASGINSRLYQKLVIQDQVASDVNANQDSLLLGSLFMIDVTLAKGASQEKLEADVDEVLKSFVKNGPSPDELRRQANKVEFALVSQLQSISSVADHMNEFEYYLDNPNSFKSLLDQYRKATPQQVRDAARKVFDLDNRVIIRVLPDQKLADEKARETRPTVESPKAFRPADPQEFTLSNGVKVYYWRREELPLMSFSALFRAGADIDPADKMGRTSLMTSMLDEGTGNMDAAQFERAIDALGASFTAGADHIAMTAHLSVTSGNFEKALDLVSGAILKPSFAKQEFDRVKRLTLEELQQELANPSVLASKVGNREFFGQNHPFGRPLSGTATSIQGINVEDLKADHAAIVQPQNATFFAAGSLDVDSVHKDLERSFGAWKPSGAPTPPITYAPPANEHLRVVVVDVPNAVQTVVRFIMPAPSYGDPSRLPLGSFNTILGGAFTSRLEQNLREDKGYTYGAGSRFIFQPSLGYFIASADVRTDVTGASVKEFLNEFNRIRKGDVSDIETAKAAATLRTEAIEALSTLDGLLSIATGLAIEGRPFSALADDIEKQGHLSASDINAISSAALPLDKAVLVLVGDKAQILAQLKGLDLPEPVLATP